MADLYVIYTDGACNPNPGRGGFAAVILHGDGYRQEVEGGCKLTTNNRMELAAVIAGLRALEGAGLPRFPVLVYSDSQYVVNAVSRKWVDKWERAEWKRWRNGVAEWIPNRDLWETLLNYCRTREVRFEWVRGHAGDPENEYCDRLAVAQARRDDLPEDPGYPPQEVPPCPPPTYTPTPQPIERGSRRRGGRPGGR